jgi:predicted short-subunit dehydrogenase-like oxidoreductase (DUF2520 family)
MEVDTSPLAGLSFCLVGPGRVGTSVASWAVARGAGLIAVAGRRAEAAAEVASRLGGRGVALEELESAGTGMLLVAVADGAIGEVAELLARRPQAPVALHTSGALGASALAPLERAGSATGTLHPLRAFPRPLPDPVAAAGTFFALDGAPEAQALGARLAAAFGGSAGIVPEAARELYHLAASVAAGGTATLVASAAELSRSLGLPPGVARGYLELARGALGELALEAERAESAERGGQPGRPEMGRAITGPVARGDFATFLRELESLRRSGLRPAVEGAAADGGRRVSLFARLALETVHLARGAGDARRLADALRRGRFLDPPGDGC